MNKAAGLKASDVLARTSQISQQIITEENNFKKAIQNNEIAERIEEIKQKINLLKRKQALFSEAAKTRQNKG